MILVDVLSSTILLRERWSRYSNQETLHPVSRIVMLGYAVAMHVKFNFRSLFFFFCALLDCRPRGIIFRATSGITSFRLR